MIQKKREEADPQILMHIKRVVCALFLARLFKEVCYRHPPPWGHCSFPHARNASGFAGNKGSIIAWKCHPDKRDETFYELCPSYKIGITGSDGKTTTATLVYELLRAILPSESTVALGGNIGTPLLPRLDELRAGDYAVTELSSFQLMTFSTCARDSNNRQHIAEPLKLAQRYG